MQNESQKVLSDIVVFNKYAKYNPEKKRREKWSELVYRYLQCLIKRFPELREQIKMYGKYIYNKKVLPSMRMMQFSGVAVERNESRGYNCAYLPVDDYKAFSEIMFLLLSGCGVGYSVQQHHIESLPTITIPKKERKYIIADSIEGWADAIKELMKSYFGLNKTKPKFDFTDIRPKGEQLVTSGGKAPGPEPLKKCLYLVELILQRKKTGEQLTSLEIHDILCHIADAVLAGGIRRAAMLALFSASDNDMRTCKSGNWWELNPQRARANNSAYLLRHKVTKEYFNELWKDIRGSGAGEPGIFFGYDKDWGANPCVEISLRRNTFCNLTEINGGLIGVHNGKTIIEQVALVRSLGKEKIEEKIEQIYDRAEKDFYLCCEVAAFFGTLQASFTDFHYLRNIWKKNTEKDSLIGVGITGICNGEILELYNNRKCILKNGADCVKHTNKIISNEIGINPAARCTTIKPSGTTSCVLGTSSGIHAWHSRYYIRNMQCRVGSDLYNYFQQNHPKLIKIMDWDKHSAVIGIPQKAPQSAVLREDENTINFLERVKLFNLEWVRFGHRNGQNYNNVSATVSIKDNEWDEVGEWMWQNKEKYNGLSVLPYFGGVYKDAPFVECTEKEYKEKMEYIKQNPIDLTKIKEDVDNTTQSSEIACAGGKCDII